MPVHNVPGIRDGLASDTLEADGLLLSVEVSVPDALASVLNGNSQSVPQPIIGTALIDTGASCCCIEEHRLLALGLHPISQIDVLSPNGSRRQNVYFTKLAFPGTRLPPTELQVIGVQLEQEAMIALIGRDMLKTCLFIYNEPLGECTLAF